MAHATFQESGRPDQGRAVILAMDLLPLLRDRLLPVEAFLGELLSRFGGDVQARLQRFLA